MSGGFAGGCRFYNALNLIKRLVNLGDAKSLACHPASTTHRQMSAEEQRKAGVTPETIRLSIGIEHVDDIIEDLDQALAAAARGATVHANGAGARYAADRLMLIAAPLSGTSASADEADRDRPRQQHARRRTARHRTAIS